MSDNQIELVYEDKEAFFDYVISKGSNVQMGARPMERLLEHEVINTISKLLAQNRRRGKKARVLVKVIGEKPDGMFTINDKRYLDFNVFIESNK